MAKTWYPVIDYLTCTECGTCVSKCPHGVYDTAKAIRKNISPGIDCGRILHVLSWILIF